MLARIFPTNEAPDSVASAADRLRDSLKLPPKSNLQTLAEAGVAEVRAKRVELLDEIHAFATSGRSADKATVVQLTAELEAFDQGPSRKAFEERARRREQFGKRAMEQLGPAVAEYRQEINRLIDEMESLNAVVLELLADSNANGFEAISGIKVSLPMAHQIRLIRQIINNNGSMF